MGDKIYLIFNSIEEELSCFIWFFYKEDEAISFVEKNNEKYKPWEDEYCHYEEIELIKECEKWYNLYGLFFLQRRLKIICVINKIYIIRKISVNNKKLY